MCYRRLIPLSSIQINHPNGIIKCIDISTSSCILLRQRIHSIPNTCHRIHVPCTIIVQACLFIELFAIELIRQFFTAAMFINQQFTVWQVGIELGDVGMIICDIRRTAEVVTVIEESFLFRSVVWNIAITSLWVIRVSWIIPAYRWTRVSIRCGVRAWSLNPTLWHIMVAKF